MAVTPSVVEVAPAGGGYEIDNVTVDNGANPSAQRQVTSLGDPEDGAARVAVKNSTPGSGVYGVVVRPRVEHDAPIAVEAYHEGTERFDTGLVALTGSLALVTTGVTSYVDVLALMNLTDQTQPFVLQDAGGGVYSGKDLEPKEMRVLHLNGLKFSGGVKMSAAASSVNVQVRGSR